MPTTKVVSFQDGNRMTVNRLLKEPTLLPARMISDLNQEFLVNAVLRKLPPTASGSYIYDESSPLFADGDAPVVEEFGEIPIVTGRIGARKAAFTVKRALAIMVSEEMKRRNDMDRVNTQIKQARNTMVRTWETLFLQALMSHPDVPTRAATAAWDSVGAKIRTDLALGKRDISKAAPADDPDNYFGFKANTLIIGEETETDLILSDDFNKAFDSAGPLATKSTAYTGEIPGQYVGLNILRSREMDRLYPGKAVLLERGTVGGIGDERPLSATPLYELRSRETWRADMVRQSAVVIDQPKAALIFTGVNT